MTITFPAREFDDAVSAEPVALRAQQVEGRQSLWRYGLLLMMLALVAESVVGRSA